MYPHQRKVINYLLQPLVQLRIGIVHLILSLAFVVALGIYMYLRLVRFADVVTTLTQADEDVAGLLSRYLTSVAWTGVGLGVTFIVISLVASIYLTHKLVGPTIAFRRHIRGLMDGNFGVKTRLRKGDAFEEVAADLNELSDRLSRIVTKA